MNEGGSGLQIASLPPLLDFILMKQHLTLQKTTCFFFISLEISLADCRIPRGKTHQPVEVEGLQCHFCFLKGQAVGPEE